MQAHGAARPLGHGAQEVPMLAQVIVVAAAAALAVASALCALVFQRYGIPRAAGNGPTRNGQETVGVSVMLCGRNVVLVVAFLFIVVHFVEYGVDSRHLLGLSPPPYLLP
jgi:hypothetical protein